MRESVWEEQFEEEMRSIEPNERRADDLIRGVEWVLAREATTGTNIPNTRVWYITCRDVPKGRSLIVYDAFSETRVHFLSVIQFSMN